MDQLLPHLGSGPTFLKGPWPLEFLSIILMVAIAKPYINGYNYN
jgi:hypothetical protein